MLQTVQAVRVTKRALEPSQVTGLRSGKLTVLRALPEKALDGKMMVLCRCDCGRELRYRAADIRRNKVKGCADCRALANTRWTKAREVALTEMCLAGRTILEIKERLARIDTQFTPPEASGIVTMARRKRLPLRVPAAVAAAPAIKAEPPPPVEMERPFPGRPSTREEAFALTVWLLSPVKDLSDVDVAAIAEKAELRRWFKDQEIGRTVRIAIGRVREIRHAARPAAVEPVA